MDKPYYIYNNNKQLMYVCPDHETFKENILSISNGNPITDHEMDNVEVYIGNDQKEIYVTRIHTWKSDQYKTYKRAIDNAGAESETIGDILFH